MANHVLKGLMNSVRQLLKPLKKDAKLVSKNIEAAKNNYLASAESFVKSENKKSEKVQIPASTAGRMKLNPDPKTNKYGGRL